MAAERLSEPPTGGRQPQRIGAAPGGSLRRKLGLLRPLPSRDIERIVDEIFNEGPALPVYLARFFFLLTLSAVIATLGLHLGSTAVVIAAMLVAPLMTPILGMAMSITLAWPMRLLAQSAITFAGVAYVLLISYGVPALFRMPHDLTLSSEILARTYPLGEDLLIALCAGVAGSYALVRRHAMTILPGVAVAVALVPPLCTGGLLTYFQEYELAANAILLFLTNLLAIIFSGCVVFIILGLRVSVRDWQRRLHTGLGLVFTIACLAVVAGPLTAHTAHRFREIRDRVVAVEVIQDWFGDQPIVVERVVVQDDLIDISLIIEVATPNLTAIGQTRIDDMRDPLQEIWNLDVILSQRLGRDVDVKVEGLIKVVRTTAVSHSRLDE
jgi:uncharacterized hydrophobic protein (TIGR00271 family)